VGLRGRRQPKVEVVVASQTVESGVPKKDSRASSLRHARPTLYPLRTLAVLLYPRPRGPSPLARGALPNLSTKVSHRSRFHTWEWAISLGWPRYEATSASTWAMSRAASVRSRRQGRWERALHLRADEDLDHPSRYPLPPRLTYGEAHLPEVSPPLRYEHCSLQPAGTVWRLCTCSPYARACGRGSC
jgi:hypothetical protein